MRTRQNWTPAPMLAIYPAAFLSVKGLCQTMIASYAGKQKKLQKQNVIIYKGVA